MIRFALLSGVVVLLICATSLVLLLGYFLPLGFVDMNYDDYRGAKQQAIVVAVGEMYQREQAGIGTYRVTTWRVKSVEKCRTGCPRPYAVKLDLFTLFGIPYGETGVKCGPPGSTGATGERSRGTQDRPLALRQSVLRLLDRGNHTTRAAPTASSAARARITWIAGQQAVIRATSSPAGKATTLSTQTIYPRTGTPSAADPAATRPTWTRRTWSGPTVRGSPSSRSERCRPLQGIIDNVT